jgi:hypothetical protein
MRGQWTVSFKRWTPEAPKDDRSPWEYLEDLTEHDRFASASDAAFTIYEHRVRDPYGDGFVPLFQPTRQDKRH